MDEIINIIINQGFAIAVAVYLLYERTRFNVKIVETMVKISTVMQSIETELRRDK